MNFVVEGERKIKVYGAYDVVVCGGGVAGISAALASARTGAKTLLIESTYTLGGLATAGLIAIYLPLCDGEGRQVSFGIAEELLRLSVAYGGERRQVPVPLAWLNDESLEAKKKSRYKTQYNPHVFAILAERLLVDNDVEILYGSQACSVILENKKISSVVVETRNGRFAINGKSFIDTTGDAYLYKLCGASTTQNKLGNDHAWWYYELLNGNHLLRLRGTTDEDSYLKTKKCGTVGLDAKELSSFTIDGHQKILEDFLKRGDASDVHAITSIATIPQVRMTRKIKGEYSLRVEDNDAYFEDSVGLFSDWTRKGKCYELPFSCLYSARVKNLFCAGRCISATEKAWELTRVIPVCAVSGQAVGTAAASFYDNDKVKIKVLQNQLRGSGVKIHLNDVGIQYESLNVERRKNVDE